jgi:HMG (high mobility group) box
LSWKTLRSGSNNSSSPVAFSDTTAEDLKQRPLQEDFSHMNNQSPPPSQHHQHHIYQQQQQQHAAAAAAAAKKPKASKRRKKRDPNEPQKPVSAYALFFRDTQASIKMRNPAANFGEVSKIVAATWDSLDPESKGIYKKRTEMAKKEYLRALAAYRANMVSKVSG